jgi:hypothetical protein
VSASTPSPVPRKPRLSGPLFDPQNADAFRAALTTTVKSKSADLKADVKRRAPVSDRPRDGAKAGTLRDSIKVRVSSNPRRITITVSSTAANPKGFPYAVAQEALSGFVSDALGAAAEPIMRGLQQTAGDFIAKCNTGVLPPSGEVRLPAE